MTCGSSMPISSAVAPLLRDVGFTKATSLPLDHLRLGLVVAACCLCVFALSHLLTCAIIYWGSYCGAPHERPVRGAERRSFWTHMREQCSCHFYRTEGDLFSMIPRKIRHLKDVEKKLKDASPEHHESFRVRCWTPCKFFLTTKLPFEELLLSDVSQQRLSRDSSRFMIPLLLLLCCCTFVAGPPFSNVIP